MENNSYSLTEAKHFSDIFLSVLLLLLMYNVWNVNGYVEKVSFFFNFYMKSKKPTFFSHVSEAANTFSKAGSF